MINSDIFPYVISGAITLLLVFLGISIYMLVKGNRNTVDYRDQLQELLSDELETQAPKTNLVYRWNHYWGKLFKEGGFARYSSDDNTAGRDIIIVGVAVTIFVSILAQNPIIGILVTGLLGAVTILFLRSRNNRKSELINAQLPGFIFALKSQIQASETNERAMLKVIEAMPSPLYEDLIIVKNKLLASSTFKESLEELSQRTSSADLKFLAACMIQAADSGANLESQLNSIQEVLESRRKVSYEISRAVKAASPAIWLTSIAIPGLFLASYFMDENSRDFWFVDPISYIVLIVIALLYLAAMWLTKRQVDSIKNL